MARITYSKRAGSGTGARNESEGKSYQFGLGDLDKSKRYRIKGVVLEQNYGVVEVWLQTYSPL